MAECLMQIDFTAGVSVFTQIASEYFVYDTPQRRVNVACVFLVTVSFPSTFPTVLLRIYVRRPRTPPLILHCAVLLSSCTLPPTAAAAARMLRGVISRSRPLLKEVVHAIC
jgi:hypothetical protein